MCSRASNGGGRIRPAEKGSKCIQPTHSLDLTQHTTAKPRALYKQPCTHAVRGPRVPAAPPAAAPTPAALYTRAGCTLRAGYRCPCRPGKCCCVRGLPTHGRCCGARSQERHVICRQHHACCTGAPLRAKCCDHKLMCLGVEWPRSATVQGRAHQGLSSLQRILPSRAAGQTTQQHST